MAKSSPNKDSGLFGNFFDLNGDGKTDAAETALMLMLFDEMQKEEKNERPVKKSFNRTVDLDD